MSRSFGATSLTTRSAIRIVPDEASSSPATIRSAVDLPDPDGPTSTVKPAVGDLQLQPVDGARAVREDLRDVGEGDASHVRSL